MKKKVNSNNDVYALKPEKPKLNYSDYFQAYIKDLRIRSGDVQTPNTFLEFIYLLGRDYLPVGVIEKIIAEAEWRTYEKDVRAVGYTNGWLAQYAGDVYNRLLTLHNQRLKNIETKEQKDDSMPEL